MRYLWIVLLIPLFLTAQNCPSILPANLNDLGESGLSAGLEIRGLYYSVDRPDGDDRLHENQGFVALDGMIQGELGSSLFWQTEGVLRHRDATDKWSCRFGETGVYFTLKQAFIESTLSDLLLRVGRQNIMFGSGLTLNHWFDGVEIEQPLGPVDLNLFSGVFAVDVARACQLEAVTEHLQCWKNFCNQSWGDLGMAGLSVSFSPIKKSRIGGMVLYQHAPNPDASDRSAVFMSAASQLPLFAGIRWNTEIALQQPREINTVMDDAWGILSELQGFSRFQSIQINQRVGILYGSGDGQQMFSPIFERLRWGERQRYSSRQGRIGMASQSFRFDRMKWLELMWQYTRQWDRRAWDGLSDELDLSAKLTVMKRHQFWVTGTLLNLSTNLPTYQIKLESRILW